MSGEIILCHYIIGDPGFCWVRRPLVLFTKGTIDIVR
jgi:hypothetical protein